MTGIQALAAAVPITGATISQTTGADAPVTVGAGTFVFLADHRPTVAAFDPVPFGEPNVGAPFVVGFQRLPDDRKEIQQPPLLQSVADRQLCLSFTQIIITDVGMRSIGPVGSLLGIGGHHTIGEWRANTSPVQDDLEWSQIKPFQPDGIGGR